MLDLNALSQLKQLKQSIRDSRDIAQGTVRGTQSRFGFVNLDDGRDAFLAPDQMDRVFPGDRVEVEVTEITEGKQAGKFDAKLEKLLDSPLKHFVGRYAVRGQGHFVVPDLPQFSRWIFLPPKTRKQAQPGDLIACSIEQHPFHTVGKAQARIDRRLGLEQEAGIETRYMLAKFDLPLLSDKDAAHQASLASAVDKQLAGCLSAPARTDLRHKSFFTIDSAKTRDMDDALSIEATEQGYRLYVAIAQPGSLLADQPALMKSAQTRANTLYFPGNHQLMLPEQLSHQSFSLVQGADRPVLLVQMDFDSQGAMIRSEFLQASICSKAKLSYEQVAEWLADVTQAPDWLQDPITALGQWSRQRNQWRANNALIMEDRGDYDFELNEQQKIARIMVQYRTTAHMIVEEAMLAANVAAGELFAKEKLPALYSSHAGPRQDRLDTIKQMLAQESELSGLDVNALADYVTLFRRLEQEQKQRLLSNLRRQLQPGKLTLAPEPHLGLGFAHYATITSPIRRYQDLHNQQVICQWLGQAKAPTLAESQVEQLQDTLNRGRQAVRAAEAWLLCQYYADKRGQTFAGTLSMVNSAGFGVRLDESGAEGFVLLRQGDVKPEFDPIALTLSLGDKQYHLDAKVDVCLDDIDTDNRKLTLSLAV